MTSIQVIWISKNDSPETNSNYYNDFELDEFEEANDNESEDGTWDEDG
jgi:hypothetical protein